MLDATESRPTDTNYSSEVIAPRPPCDAESAPHADPSRSDKGRQYILSKRFKYRCAT